MKVNNFPGLRAFTALVFLIVAGTSSCDTGDDGSKSEIVSENRQNVPLNQVCGGILKEDSLESVRSSVGTRRVQEETEPGGIEKKVERVYAKGHDSDFTLLCSFYAETEGREEGMAIDFRREVGPPANLRNSNSSWTIYKINEISVARVNDNTARLDVLCRLNESPEGAEEENTIRVSLGEEMGIDSGTKINILTATAEKVASGLGCVNDIKFPDVSKISPLPQQ